jgi:hypothetical protein
MIPLSKEETALFERRMDLVRQTLEDIDLEIERELREVQQRIEALQEKRKAALKVYDAACTMLGIVNDLDGPDHSGNGSG